MRYRYLGNSGLKISEIEVGERETLLSIDKARRMLGYAPEHSWRDHAGSVA